MNKWMAIAIAVAALVVSCSSAGGASDADFPAFVYNSSSSLEGYRIAKRIPEVLEQMPCYCGCGKANQHHNLKECFIKPTGGYDDHASGCDVCVKEAVDVDNWHRQGKSLAEVRRLLDAKYQDYGQPTDTAPVE